MAWKTVERPGYLGKKRNEVHASWTKQYGEHQWRLAYQWGDLVIPRDFGIQIYEDGYYEFFKENPETLEWLVSTASDVYDTAPTNVQAGFDYTQQETPNSHIHDVAIRRAVARSGTWFTGDHLMHVRWKESEGFRINPGVVPFHQPELIYSGEIKDYGGRGTWWNEKTIEDFYQRNKLLQVQE
ncbi:hypothetical protein J4210_02780 [Candidatus Woesearchaeota archaeon]|nr:hypothetical protein [Candidatus Woesearchaeota archaeon]